MNELVYKAEIDKLYAEYKIKLDIAYEKDLQTNKDKTGSDSELEYTKVHKEFILRYKELQRLRNA